MAKAASATVCSNVSKMIAFLAEETWLLAESQVVGGQVGASKIV